MQELPVILSVINVCFILVDAIWVYFRIFVI